MTVPGVCCLEIQGFRNSRFWECYCYNVRLAVDVSHLVHFHFPFPSLIYLLGVLESCDSSSGSAAF